ncbi:class I SAM-dependent methyltransferase [Burkholderiaceae bacterium DAT-1]|nr:class I SAM-dependent methyltransferase [Burkholderiaceae bacterium DAT-1]
MMENTYQHVYTRQVDSDEENSLTRLAGRITPGARVLDVGTGSGGLAIWLAQQELNCTIDGLTHNPDELQLAAPHYRAMFLADLDREHLPAELASQRYDYIVCADVLEHLYNPEHVLRILVGLLADQGKVLISLPNVAYAGVVCELLDGQFVYTHEGLLDRTHLRFFTHQTLSNLLRSCGLGVSWQDHFCLPLHQTEFSDEYSQMLSGAIKAATFARPGADVYQFVLEASPEAESAVLVEQHEMKHVFPVQVFWGSDFSESNSVVSFGEVGREKQRISIHLPDGIQSPASLRLDVCDRPCILDLWSISLTCAGETIWHWNGTQEAFRGENDIQWLSANRILVTGTDPFLICGLTHLDLSGARLEIDMGWPASEDMLGVLSVIKHDFGQRAALVASHLGIPEEVFSGSIQQLDQLLDAASALPREKAQLAYLEASLVERDASIVQLTSAVKHAEGLLLASRQESNTLSLALANAERMVKETRNEWQTLDSAFKELQLEFSNKLVELDATISEMQVIKQSRWYRLGRLLKIIRN